MEAGAGPSVVGREGARFRRRCAGCACLPLAQCRMAPPHTSQLVRNQPLSQLAVQHCCVHRHCRLTVHAALHQLYAPQAAHLLPLAAVHDSLASAAACGRCLGVVGRRRGLSLGAVALAAGAVGGALGGLQEGGWRPLRLWAACPLQGAAKPPQRR